MKFSTLPTVRRNPLNSCGMNTMKNSERWSRTLLSGSATIFIIWSASPQKMKRWLSVCLSTTFPLRLSMLLLQSMRSGKLNFRSRACFTSAITVHFRILRSDCEVCGRSENSLPRSDHTGKEIHGRSDF